MFVSICEKLLSYYLEMEMGMKTLVLLLLLSVAATTLVHSLPTNADMSEKDTEGLFSLFWHVILKTKQS